MFEHSFKKKPQVDHSNCSRQRTFTVFCNGCSRLDSSDWDGEGCVEVGENGQHSEGFQLQAAI